MQKEMPEDPNEILTRLLNVVITLETLLNSREASPLTQRLEDMMHALSRIAAAMEDATKNAPDHSQIEDRLAQLEQKMNHQLRATIQLRDWLIAPTHNAAARN